MDARPETWSVGELARRCGLTVRTLHHYDEIGLLRASERTYAGHRRYGARDVERLLRIVGLRRIGLSLEDVGGVLDGGPGDLAAVVRRQIAHVDAELAAHARLRELLVHIRDTLDGRDTPAVEDILEAIERTTMIERHYTPEQLEQLAARREELGGDEAMRRVEAEWKEILDALRAELDAGTDPADPRLRAYGERANELVLQFTGGDPGITGSLRKVWAEEDPEVVSRGTVDRPLMEYLGRVQKAAGCQ